MLSLLFQKVPLGNTLWPHSTIRPWGHESYTEKHYLLEGHFQNLDDVWFATSPNHFWLMRTEGRSLLCLPPCTCLSPMWRHVIWWLLFWGHSYNEVIEGRLYIPYSDGLPITVSKVFKNFFRLYSDFLWPSRDIQFLRTFTAFGDITSSMWFAVVLWFNIGTMR